MNYLLHFIISLINSAYLAVENVIADFTTISDSIYPFFCTLVVIVIFLLIYWLFRLTVSFMSFVFNL